MLLTQVYLQRATRDFDQPYSYLLPEELSGQVAVGSLVSVPFGRGNSERQAWVASLSEADTEMLNDQDFELKSVSRVLSPPLLREDQFLLAQEMRRRYFCSISQALALMAPQVLLSTGSKTQRYAYLTDPDEAVDLLEEGSLRSMGHVRVLEFLLEVEEASLQEIMAACGVSRSVLDTLRKKGLITHYNKEVARESLSRERVEAEGSVPILNSDQAEALASLLENNSDPAKDNSEYLLFGVTGSGKTEVYLRAAEQVLRQGRDVLILVPEISLTPLICDRIESRFGQNAAVLHSRLSPGERYDQWQSIRSGKKHLVAGARSAVFAPLEDIGLIVIDEEQEATYKSERTPRYDSLDVARIRSHMHGSKLLLASATPSVESYYRSQSGRAKLLTLSQRAGGASLPHCELVDMRQEMAFDPATVISRPLKQALEETFARKEQAMIFLNRRGNASFRLCQDCGYIHQCSNCEVSMTDHLNPRQPRQHLLICHYCGKIEAAPLVCPACGSEHFGPYGLGTQQAERVLQELFPEQKILRMDLDTTSGRFGHSKILGAFARKEADLLVGTQMIAKGHDFPDVTTVGILAADMMLGQSDYLAEERCFQLLAQAAGRAGRRGQTGQVLIQSFNPENFVIQAALSQDYQAFYEEEIRKRRVLAYPPFRDLGVVTISSHSQSAAVQAARRLESELYYLMEKNELKQQISFFPAQPAPIPRLRKRWRYRLLIKSSSRELLTRCLNYLNQLKMPDSISLTCDINPKHWA